MNPKYIREIQDILNSQVNHERKMKNRVRSMNSGHIFVESILVSWPMQTSNARACALGLMGCSRRLVIQQHITLTVRMETLLSGVNQQWTLGNIRPRSECILTTFSFYAFPRNSPYNFCKAAPLSPAQWHSCPDAQLGHPALSRKSCNYICTYFHLPWNRAPPGVRNYCKWAQRLET